MKIDNAMILAAGMSTRLEPISHEIPKALLTVKGEVLIERQIRQLQDNGINDITVVAGYKKEQFDYLQTKYQVSVVENPYYQTRNNHSSLYVVKEKLKNTYISCGDLYFLKNPFLREEERPYYATEFEAGVTDEWCVEADQNSLITDVTIGGCDAWIMRGEVLFDEQFSAQLVPLLDAAMQSGEQAGVYWEDLYLLHKKEMKLYEKRNVKPNVLEFDSLEELRAVEERYQNHSGNPIMEHLSERLSCEEMELQEFRPIKKDECVLGVSFVCRNIFYEFLYEDFQLIEKGQI